MPKYDIDLCCAVGFHVTGVDAPSQDEAIEKATKLVLDTTALKTAPAVKAGNLEYDHCSYVQLH